ncbi:MAG: redoxin family protein [Dehalococcoidia bacterium]
MLEPGTEAPSLSLDAADGEHYDLASALAAGPVLLTFFQLECQTCEMSYLFWDRAFEEYTGDRFQLWAIGLDSEDDASAFWDKSGVSFPVLFGGHAQVEEWQLVSTPAHALIDSDGSVIASFEAFDRGAWNSMLATVAERLGQAAIDVPASEAPEFRPGCTIHT